MLAIPKEDKKKKQIKKICLHGVYLYVIKDDKIEIAKGIFILLLIL